MEETEQDPVFEGLPDEWPEPDEDDRRSWAFQHERARLYYLFGQEA